jgi:head-tail adaptor
VVQTSRLTEKLEILQLATVSASTYGEAVQTYKVVQTIYASILAEKGNTSFDSPGTTYNNSISFYGRYIPMLNKKDFRIRYCEEDYRIEEITHVSRNAATIIRCVNTV